MTYTLGLILLGLASLSWAATKGPQCPPSDGEYATLFPHETNCSQFYKCSEGVAYLYNCSAGLNFNAALNICDWPDNVKCERHDNATFPSSTVKPNNNDTQENVPNLPDPRCPPFDGEYATLFPHKTNCSQFYKCSEGVAYLYNCSAGLYFNPNLNICDWPANVNCKAHNSAKNVETHHSNNAHKSQLTGPRCPFPDKEYLTLLPHEAICSKFYKCSNGVAYLSDCPSGLDFNPVLKVCDWPYRAGCWNSNVTDQVFA